MLLYVCKGSYVQQHVNWHSRLIWHILIVSCATVTEGSVSVIHYVVDLKFVVVVDDVMTSE